MPEDYLASLGPVLTALQEDVVAASAPAEYIDAYLTIKLFPLFEQEALYAGCRNCPWSSAFTCSQKASTSAQKNFGLMRTTALTRQPLPAPLPDTPSLSPTRRLAAP